MLTLHEAEENVGSHSPLVRFVQHDHGIFRAVRVDQ